MGSSNAVSIFISGDDKNIDNSGPIYVNEIASLTTRKKSNKRIKIPLSRSGEHTFENVTFLIKPTRYYGGAIESSEWQHITVSLGILLSKERAKKVIFRFKQIHRICENRNAIHIPILFYWNLSDEEVEELFSELDFGVKKVKVSPKDFSIALTYLFHKLAQLSKHLKNAREEKIKVLVEKNQFWEIFRNITPIEFATVKLKDGKSVVFVEIFPFNKDNFQEIINKHEYTMLTVPFPAFKSDENTLGITKAIKNLKAFSDEKKEALSSIGVLLLRVRDTTKENPITIELIDTFVKKLSPYITAEACTFEIPKKRPERTLAKILIERFYRLINKQTKNIRSKEHREKETLDFDKTLAELEKIENKLHTENQEDMAALMLGIGEKTLPAVLPEGAHQYKKEIEQIDRIKQSVKKDIKKDKKIAKKEISEFVEDVKKKEDRSALLKNYYKKGTKNASTTGKKENSWSLLSGLITSQIRCTLYKTEQNLLKITGIFLKEDVNINEISIDKRKEVFKEVKETTRKKIKELKREIENLPNHILSDEAKKHVVEKLTIIENKAVWKKLEKLVKRIKDIEDVLTALKELISIYEGLEKETLLTLLNHFETDYTEMINRLIAVNTLIEGVESVINELKEDQNRLSRQIISENKVVKDIYGVYYYNVFNKFLEICVEIINQIATQLEKYYDNFSRILKTLFERIKELDLPFWDTQRISKKINKIIVRDFAEESNKVIKELSTSIDAIRSKLSSLANGAFLGISRVVGLLQAPLNRIFSSSFLKNIATHLKFAIGGIKSVISTFQDKVTYLQQEIAERVGEQVIRKIFFFGTIISIFGLTLSFISPSFLSTLNPELVRLVSSITSISGMAKTLFSTYIRVDHIKASLSIASILALSTEVFKIGVPEFLIDNDSLEIHLQLSERKKKKIILSKNELEKLIDFNYENVKSRRHKVVFEIQSQLPELPEENSELELNLWIPQVRVAESSGSHTQHTKTGQIEDPALRKKITFILNHLTVKKVVNDLEVDKTTDELNENQDKEEIVTFDLLSEETKLMYNILQNLGFSLALVKISKFEFLIATFKNRTRWIFAYCKFNKKDSKSYLEKIKLLLLLWLVTSADFAVVFSKDKLPAYVHAYSKQEVHPTRKIKFIGEEIFNFCNAAKDLSTQLSEKKKESIKICIDSIFDLETTNL